MPKLLNSMQAGADRIRNIVQSLRNFSRLDEATIKEVDIHEGIENTLMILASKLEKIQVIKEYDCLPKLQCYARELNQVFMNLLVNAIDALEEGIGHGASGMGHRAWGINYLQFPIPNSQFPISNSQFPLPYAHCLTIWIRTELREDNQVAIRIRDNGVGMTEEVKSKIYDPFFTTKPIGKANGLGLSISYQIVVEKHGGNLICQSALGEGTEFTILLPCK